MRRDGSRVRCFTRNGHDWADRFPSIVHAAAHLEGQSFLIEGEVVIISIDGMSDFYALRSRRREPEAVLHAFDLETDRKGLFSQCFVLEHKRLFFVDINDLADDDLNAATILAAVDLRRSAPPPVEQGRRCANRSSSCTAACWPSCETMRCAGT